MSEENKALVGRFIDEVTNKGDQAIADEILDSNLVGHTLPPEMPLGPEGLRQLVTIFRTAFPDLHMIKVSRPRILVASPVHHR